MEALAALLNLTIGRMTVYALVVADTAISDGLVIFLLWPDWFRDLSTLKLLLLSVAITAPFLVVGSILSVLHMDSSDRRNSKEIHEGEGVEVAVTRLVANAVGLAACCHLILLMLFFVTVGVDSLVTRYGATADHLRLHQHVYWATQASFLGEMATIPVVVLAKGRAALWKQIGFGILLVISALLPFLVLKNG